MEDVSKRLEAANRKRSELESFVQKNAGKLESARQSLQRLEEECRSKGVDPMKLDETIQKLEERILQLLTQLEADVKATEKSLEPYNQEF